MSTIKLRHKTGGKYLQETNYSIYDYETHALRSGPTSEGESFVIILGFNYLTPPNLTDANKTVYTKKRANPVWLTQPFSPSQSLEKYILEEWEEEEDNQIDYEKHPGLGIGSLEWNISNFFAKTSYSIATILILGEKEIVSLSNLANLLDNISNRDLFSLLLSLTKLNLISIDIGSSEFSLTSLGQKYYTKFNYLEN